MLSEKLYIMVSKLQRSKFISDKHMKKTFALYKNTNKSIKRLLQYLEVVQRSKHKNIFLKSSRRRNENKKVAKAVDVANVFLVDVANPI